MTNNQKFSVVLPDSPLWGSGIGGIGSPLSEVVCQWFNVMFQYCCFVGSLT